MGLTSFFRQPRQYLIPRAWELNNFFVQFPIFYFDNSTFRQFNLSNWLFQKQFEERYHFFNHFDDFSFMFIWKLSSFKNIRKSWKQWNNGMGIHWILWRQGIRNVLPSRYSTDWKWKIPYFPARNKTCEIRFYVVTVILQSRSMGEKQNFHTGTVRISNRFPGWFWELMDSADVILL